MSKFMKTLLRARAFKLQPLAIILISVVIFLGVFTYMKSESSSFSIGVVPTHIERAIPGQKCIFLVYITDLKGESELIPW